MSKSLEFCKEIAPNPNRSEYSDRDWSKAVESMDTEAYFDKVLKGQRQLTVTGKDCENNDLKLSVKLHFDKDAYFDYFTSESIIHDGTLLFVQDTINACMERVLLGLTYNKKMQPPHYGDTIEYTVGNFVILNEYNNKSFSDDNPHLCSRTTVLLPLKYENKGKNGVLNNKIIKKLKDDEKLSEEEIKELAIAFNIHGVNIEYFKKIAQYLGIFDVDATK